MSYVLITRNPGGLATYDRVNEFLGAERPAGNLHHLVGELDGSLCITDVWESRAHADRFAAERLFPAFEKAGVKPADGEVLLSYETR